MTTIQDAHASLRKIFADLAADEEAKLKATQTQLRAAQLTLAEISEQIRQEQEDLANLRNEKKATAAHVNRAQQAHDQLVADGLSKKAQLIQEGEQEKARMITELAKAVEGIRAVKRSNKP